MVLGRRACQSNHISRASDLSDGALKTEDEAEASSCCVMDGDDSVSLGSTPMRPPPHPHPSISLFTLVSFQQLSPEKNRVLNGGVLERADAGTGH